MVDVPKDLLIFGSTHNQAVQIIGTRAACMNLVNTVLWCWELYACGQSS